MQENHTILVELSQENYSDYSHVVSQRQQRQYLKLNTFITAEPIFIILLFYQDLPIYVTEEVKLNEICNVPLFSATVNQIDCIYIKTAFTYFNRILSRCTSPSVGLNNVLIICIITLIVIQPFALIIIILLLVNTISLDTRHVNVNI